MILFWVLWFCFEFCDSVLGFVILFWVLCFYFVPIDHRHIPPLKTSYECKRKWSLSNYHFCVLFVFSGFAIFITFIIRKEASNQWGLKSLSSRSCIDLHWFLFCSRIWPFLLLRGWTCRTWTIFWTEGLSKCGDSMSTPALMEVDNDDNVVDIINCVALYYEKGTSGNAFLPKEKFRAPISRQVKTLKVVKETVRWVDLSLRVQENSREIWVSTTSISLYIQYPGIWMDFVPHTTVVKG